METDKQNEQEAEALNAPVRFLEGESAKDAPQEGIALCLSGGGYRAMLFHTGVLWRLNEVGMLPKLNRISSVSGGSITAGVLYAAHTKKWILTRIAHRAFRYSSHTRTSQES